MHKTNDDRILRIANLSEDHYGREETLFVGYKYEVASQQWVAKIQLTTHDLYESGNSPTEALKALKNRVKKIIKRYHQV